MSLIQSVPHFLSCPSAMQIALACRILISSAETGAKNLQRLGLLLWGSSLILNRGTKVGLSQSLVLKTSTNLFLRLNPGVAFLPSSKFNYVRRFSYHERHPTHCHSKFVSRFPSQRPSSSVLATCVRAFQVSYTFTTSFVRSLPSIL